MNKKASTAFAAYIMVIMTLLLFGAIIGAFAISKPVEKQINPRILEQVYAKESQVKFLLSKGVSLQDAATLNGCELVGGKPGWVAVGVHSSDGKIQIIYQFDSTK